MSWIDAAFAALPDPRTGNAKRHDLSRNSIRIWISKLENGVFDGPSGPQTCSEITKPTFLPPTRACAGAGICASVSAPLSTGERLMLADLSLDKHILQDVLSKKL